jgi:hypothetical protein
MGRAPSAIPKAGDEGVADLFDGLREAIGDIADSFEQMKTSTKTYGGTSIGDSAASAAGVGGRFRFPDVATAKKIRGSFADRRDNIKKRRTRIERAQEALAQQFAADPESLGYSDQAIQSLTSLYRLNESMYKYSDNYIKKLDKAIEAYERNEDETSRSFSGGQAQR